MKIANLESSPSISFSIAFLNCFFQGNYEDGRPHLRVIIPSAACSGALISCILTPTELTKVSVASKFPLFSNWCKDLGWFRWHLMMWCQDLLQCRMQVQGKDVMHGARYSSPLDCAVKTLESEGVRSTCLLLLFGSLTVARLIICCCVAA